LCGGEAFFPDTVYIITLFTATAIRLDICRSNCTMNGISLILVIRQQYLIHRSSIYC